MRTPTGDTIPLNVEGYSWSADRSRLLVFTNSARVWRANTRGDFARDATSMYVVRRERKIAPAFERCDFFRGESDLLRNAKSHHERYTVRIFLFAPDLLTARGSEREGRWHRGRRRECSIACHHPVVDGRASFLSANP